MAACCHFGADLRDGLDNRFRSRFSDGTILLTCRPLHLHFNFCSGPMLCQSIPILFNSPTYSYHTIAPKTVSAAAPILSQSFKFIPRTHDKDLLRLISLSFCKSDQRQDLTDDSFLLKSPFQITIFKNCKFSWSRIGSHPWSIST